MRKKYKLITSFILNDTEIDIEILGNYRPYQRATYMDPPEGDEMELTFVNDSNTGKDITHLFTDEQLEYLNDELYRNGEEA